MIDINLIRNNPELVKNNIKKKFQDEKLSLVDKVIDLDKKARILQQEGDDLRAKRNSLSSQIGTMMREKQIDKANELKNIVKANNERIENIDKELQEINDEIKSIMMKIPNIIADDVPIGKDDSENVELEKFGKPTIPDFEIPYHADILESINGLDKESAGRTSGTGFYYLIGDAARLHEAMIAYGRDYMIDQGFTYCIPPFMIRSDVVNGVMSFAEMEAMMYKIENEDLFLVGTSEHSMIGKFKGQIISEQNLPIKMTSYSPCFRKEGGAHGLEERGLYRVHQFEKQEMIVICKPEDSMNYYNKMWKYTVDVFRNLDIPVRTLECCSGDLADLKVKSCDVEAWSPRQKKYFEVGSCSTLGDAQARRLGIRAKGEKGTYFLHTLNNTVLASPRALIAFLENNLQADGSIKIPTKQNLKHGNYSFQDLILIAKKYGATLNGYHYQQKQEIKNEQNKWLLASLSANQGKHLVIVKKIKFGTVHIQDPEKGNYQITFKKFCNLWDGNILKVDNFETKPYKLDIKKQLIPIILRVLSLISGILGVFYIDNKQKIFISVGMLLIAFISEIFYRITMLKTMKKMDEDILQNIERIDDNFNQFTSLFATFKHKEATHISDVCYSSILSLFLIVVVILNSSFNFVNVIVLIIVACFDVLLFSPLMKKIKHRIANSENEISNKKAIFKDKVQDLINANDKSYEYGRIFIFKKAVVILIAFCLAFFTTYAFENVNFINLLLYTISFYYLENSLVALFSFLEKTNELKSLRCMIINLIKLKKPNFFD